jgi:hypothetical protein
MALSARSWTTTTRCPFGGLRWHEAFFRFVFAAAALQIGVALRAVLGT